MNNLQELYDAYIATRPYSGKIKSATSMMIHVCKAFELPSQEEITADMFEEIPNAISKYFRNYPLKSTQDKAIIAEMIGRVGPNKKLEGLLDKLLTDDDENVRQYSLHSLGYFGKSNPDKVMPFIERFRKSNDYTMKFVAAHLITHLLSVDNQDVVFTKIKEWYNSGDIDFVQDVSQKIIEDIKKGEQKTISIEKFTEWINLNFDNKIKIKS